MGFIDLFPKDKNRETEVSRGFRFFGDRGTVPWHSCFAIQEKELVAFCRETKLLS